MIVLEGKKRVHAPAVGLRCLDDAERGSVLHAPTRVLEFCFAIYLRARLFRKAFQEDLSPLCSGAGFLVRYGKSEVSQGGCFPLHQ